MGARRRARHRPLGRRHRRVAGRDDRARGRPRAARRASTTSSRSRRPRRPGAMAIAWNHIQLELVDRLGDEGLALARQLAMTTYRSEADFDGRFGREREADGRFSINSYLDHQGDKLVDRFDRDTYRTLVAGDGRPRRRAGPGRDRGRRSRRSPRRASASPASASRATSCTARRRSGRWSTPRRRPASTRPTASSIDQGPRRVPDRVGPADPDPG